MLTRSGLTYPEVSSEVCHDSFCQLGSSISLPWVIYFEAFYLHVVSSFSCIPVICPKLVLFLAPLQFVHLFCNLSKCILLLEGNVMNLLSHYGPRVDLTSYRNEYQGHFLGGKCGRCVRLTTLPPSCAVVTKSGNLNFLEPSGPLQACDGTDLPLLLLRSFYQRLLAKLQ